MLYTLTIASHPHPISHPHPHSSTAQEVQLNRTPSARVLARHTYKFQIYSITSLLALGQIACTITLRALLALFDRRECARLSDLFVDEHGDGFVDDRTDGLVSERLDGSVDGRGVDGRADVFETGEGSFDEFEDRSDWGVDSRQVVCARRAVLRLAAAIEGEQLHLARLALGMPHLRFSTPFGREEYTIVVPRAALCRVPHDWTRVAQTKAAVRFRPTQVEGLLPELALLRQREEEAAAAAWSSLQARVCGRLPQLRAWVDRLGQLDCLLAFAKLAHTPGYSAPTILEGCTPHLSIEQGRHPLLEAFGERAVVPNCVDLRGGASRRGETNGREEDVPRCVVVMGPNSGGKSVYLRQERQAPRGEREMRLATPHEWCQLRLDPG